MLIIDFLRKITHCGHYRIRTGTLAVKCKMWHPATRPKFSAHFTLYGKFFVTLSHLITYHIAGYPMSIIWAYVFCTLFTPVSWLCPYVLQFRQGVSLARPASFAMRQHTCGRSAVGDCGHNIGNTLFSGSVQGVFPA